MRTRLIATLTALSLSAFAASAHADESGVTPQWQQQGYVMDVIVVTAPRPEAVAAVSEDVTLASEQPGYVQDVVVVRASRSEVLASARAAALKAALERQPVTGAGSGGALGSPAR